MPEFQTNDFLNRSFKGISKCERGASFNDIDKSEFGFSRVTCKLALGMAWALQRFKSIIFFREAFRELKSLRLAIIDVISPPPQPNFVPNMQAARKLTSLKYQLCGPFFC